MVLTALDIRRRSKMRAEWKTAEIVESPFTTRKNVSNVIHAEWFANPEDGNGIFLRIVSRLAMDYRAILLWTELFIVFPVLVSFPV
jgi:hypothetical protein